jgi:Ca-activated chloride channel family protein
MNETPSYRTFATSMALVLAELGFWLALAAGWFVLKRVLPNGFWEHGDWWPVLGVLPLSLVVFLFFYHWQQRMARRLSHERSLGLLVPGLRPRRQAWRFALWRAGLAFALLGLLDLKVGAKLEEVKSEGRDVMIALDVSNSMRAEDLGMRRLDLARQTTQRLLSRLSGDRVGLVIFAGDAYVQCPITTDFGALALFLDGVSTDLVAAQGTAMGAAIDLCVSAFHEESQAGKAIILLGDGENHEDDAVEAAAEAAEQGIQVHTVGMGSREGAPIPLVDGAGRPRGFKLDGSGQPVVSALDEKAMVAIAEAGGGTFTRAGVGYVELKPMLDALDLLDTEERGTLAYTDFTHFFVPFIWLALLLLVLEWLLMPMAPPRLRPVMLLFPLALPVMGVAQTPTPLTQKAHLIEGLERYRSGIPGADSLFALGTGHPTLGPVAHFNRGRALLDADRPGEARQALQQAIQGSPDASLRSRAWHNIGATHLAAQEWDRAIEAYRHALRQDPRNEDARTNLAYAMRQKKQAEENESSPQNQDQNQQQQEQNQQDQDQKNQQSQDQQSQDRGENSEENGGENPSPQDAPQGAENKDPKDGRDRQEGGAEQPAKGLTREEAARLLESLQQDEAAIQARIREKRVQGKPRKIEKDW